MAGFTPPFPSAALTQAVQNPPVSGSEAPVNRLVSVRRSAVSSPAPKNTIDSARRRVYTGKQNPSIIGKGSIQI